MKIKSLEEVGAPDTTTSVHKGQYRRLPIARVRNREGHNRFLDTKHVSYLAGCIKEQGLRHPITAIEVGDWYEVIAGLHRFEAYKQIGYTHIDAKLLDPSTSQAELTEISIAENSARKDESLSSLLARIDRIMRERNCKFEEAARRASIGKSKTSKLKTAKNGLCEHAIALVDNNPKEIGISIAYDVARLAKSDAAQMEALESILDGTMTRDEMVKWLRGCKPSTKKRVKIHTTLKGITVHLGVPAATTLDTLIEICGELRDWLKAEKKHDRRVHELPDHIGGQHVATG